MIYIQVPSCGDGYVNLSAVFLFLRFYLHGVVLNISGVIYTGKYIFTSGEYMRFAISSLLNIFNLIILLMPLKNQKIFSWFLPSIPIVCKIHEHP